MNTLSRRKAAGIMSGAVAGSALARAAGADEEPALELSLA